MLLQLVAFIDESFDSDFDFALQVEIIIQVK